VYSGDCQYKYTLTLAVRFGNRSVRSNPDLPKNRIIVSEDNRAIASESMALAEGGTVPSDDILLTNEAKELIRL
jgi:hypothetical protein